MSRTLSADFKAALFGPQTDEVVLQLLTFEHEDLVTPVRVVNDTQDVTSRSNVYTAFPFELALPGEDEESIPRVELVFDNVSQLLLTEIRSTVTAPTVTMELVLASDPDTVEAGPWTFTWRDTTYNASVIRATLAYEDLLNEPFPAQRFVPASFPGLF